MSPLFAAAETAKWSLVDYQRMVELGILSERSVELIRGDILEMSPEGPDHAQTSTDSADYLRRLFGDRALIRDSKPITLFEQASEPAPDIAIVAPFRDRYRNHHPSPEDIFLLIEYANMTLSRDTELKRQLYASAEILEYWVVNLRQRSLIVYRDPQSGDYQTSQTLTAGIIHPLAFPDIAIELQSLI